MKTNSLGFGFNFFWRETIYLLIFFLKKKNKSKNVTWFSCLCAANVRLKTNSKLTDRIVSPLSFCSLKPKLSNFKSASRNLGNRAHYQEKNLLSVHTPTWPIEPSEASPRNLGNTAQDREKNFLSPHTPTNLQLTAPNRFPTRVVGKKFVQLAVDNYAVR